jgi:hypothetical protein
LTPISSFNFIDSKSTLKFNVLSSVSSTEFYVLYFSRDNPFI